MRMTAALFMQHAKRMRPIILSSMACLAIPGFATLSQTVLNKISQFQSNTPFVFISLL